MVIVGGGFAGIACAQRLADDSRLSVTLLDRNSYHQFQPLLYQMATAELGRRDTSFDLTEMFAKNDNITVRQAEVASIDPQAGVVTLADGASLHADVLVLAAGAQPSFFKTPGAREHAFPLYSVDDAERIGERLLAQFAVAATEPTTVDPDLLTFVIVGGGPTGVETAGALAELIRDVMPHVYEQLPPDASRVILVNLGPTLLSAFSDKAHAYAAEQLRQRGVQLRLGVSVTEVAPDHVVLSDGSTINSRLVVWGGGEKAAAIAERCGLPQGHGGRIDVGPDLGVPGFPNVFALGDVANIADPQDVPLPQLGSVAQQSGRWAAENILADLEGDPREPFEYDDKGIMAMIGRKAAIAEIGEHRHEMHGRIAFAAWLGVHAQLLANRGAELNAFVTWAEEFYLRPHHRSAQLLRGPSAAPKPLAKDV